MIKSFNQIFTKIMNLFEPLPKLDKDIQVNAEVLSINENIVEGKLIGDTLSSPDGEFRTDKIVVGGLYSSSR